MISIVSDLSLRFPRLGGSRSREGSGLGVLAIVGFALLLAAPLLATLMQYAASRNREKIGRAHV